MTSDPNTHYERLAAKFDEMCLDRPNSDYQRWLLDEVGKRLNLKQDSVFVDIGSGTGAFMRALRSRMDPKPTNTWFCVEPSSNMLQHVTEARLAAQCEGAEGIVPICQDGVSYWKDGDKRADAVLMKEVVHHIKLDERLSYFQSVYKSLSVGGRIVITTRPSKPMEHPLFSAARQRWEVTAIDPMTQIGVIEEAGFKMTVEPIQFKVHLEKERWYTMVRNRFWSVFSDFTDAELEAGIAELEEQNKANTHFVYNENTLIITCEK